MQGETFLCISTRAWDSLWAESQKIMSLIAKNNRVLYFEPGRSVNQPILNGMWHNFPNFFRLKTRKLNHNLTVISTPSNLPIARRHLPEAILKKTTPWIINLNSRLIARQIRWVMKELEVRNPILWLYSPYHADLTGKFGEKLSCYHNYDEFPDFINNARIKSLVQKYDDQLSNSVDLVFTTSRSQMERRKRVNLNTFFVPNGVDFKVFNQALVNDLPAPDDIAQIPAPIIGYAGALSYYIDAQLLLNISEAYPDYSLVLIGPDQLGNSDIVKKLKARSNVYFLGFKPLNQMSKYIKVFDAAIMPYKLEGHVLSAYPQKLHEYLAVGRATVAVALPELNPYKQLVRIAENKSQFIDHIRQAINDYHPKTVQKRVAVASENTWEHRVENYYEILNQHLIRTLNKKAA